MNQEFTAGEIGESVPLTLSISAAPLHEANELQLYPIGVVAVLNVLPRTSKLKTQR